MRLKINKPDDTVYEWIPYNEFINVKEIGDSLTTAIWKDGSLYYDTDRRVWTRESYVKVCLNYLHNLQDFTDEVINKIKSYLLGHYGCPSYGISQNPDTKDYILVVKANYIKLYCKKCGNKYKSTILDKWCKSCMNCLKNDFISRTSGNEKIDDFIQKMRLKPENPVFEWIPYNEFINVKEIEDNCLATVVCKEGPFYYDTSEAKWIRISYKIVCLRYLHNSRDTTDEVINKIESYLINGYIEYYGMSQNPDTKDYILVFSKNYLKQYCKKCGNKYERGLCNLCLKDNFNKWTSGNEKIDNFIQKMQLKVNESYGFLFEWIPYDRFVDIREIRIDNFAIAIWNDGPLYNRKRKSNEKVLLKYLHNSQNINNEFLNKITYLMENSYGISQNPNTKDYILVYKVGYHCENCGEKYNYKFEIDNKSCMSCQTNHENSKINNLIQEMKLNIDHNSIHSSIIFEWIPYNQFKDVEEIGKGGFSTIYSAIWKNGLLYYSKESWERKSNTRVALKCLHNSQNFIMNL
ncbi:unnamed protein product [Rhizophagus irregularis]|nr:unnamed protein product [Rhizophagus irregularis]